jgi:hypothetical protein
MQKQRSIKSAVFRSIDPAVAGGGATLDDPRDAIEQELLGIWLSISRLRQLIRARPPSQIATKKAAPPKKQPRRKAA